MTSIVVERIARTPLISSRKISAIRGICPVKESATGFLIEVEPLSIHGADFSLNRPGRSEASVPIFGPIGDGLSSAGHPV
jgi:hypothetical protein